MKDENQVKGCFQVGLIWRPINDLIERELEDSAVKMDNDRTCKALKQEGFQVKLQIKVELNTVEVTCKHKVNNWWFASHINV